MRVIFSMCCMEIYCIHWQKGVKYVSPSAKGFLWYLRWIPQHKKGYLVYVPGTRKIISSYDVVFSESSSSTLSYTSQPHVEAMDVRPDV